MISYGIPRVATIGTTLQWLTAIAGFTPTTFDLRWMVGALQIDSAANSAGTGWITSASFDGLNLGEAAWSLTTIQKVTATETEVATGRIFLETPEYTIIRQQLEAADLAIKKALEGGGYQTISIKGRSSTKYGLGDLRSLRSQLARQLEMMRSTANDGGSSQVLIRFV